jgi:hypothetical protein
MGDPQTAYEEIVHCILTIVSPPICRICIQFFESYITKQVFNTLERKLEEFQEVQSKVSI